MKKLFFILIIFYSSVYIGCDKKKSLLIYEDDSVKLRIINIIEYSQTVFVNINDELSIDTLSCNRSSGYTKINSDSIKVEIFDRFNNSQLIYDTLLVLESEEFYTLLLFKRNGNVSSLLVQDSDDITTETSSLRIFNNSKVGEPFTFLMKSIADTVSFVSSQLYNLSSYKSLKDTLYTPALSFISNGTTADYQNVSLARTKHYTIIITDTYSVGYSYYPYVVFLFIDVYDNREILRL